MSLHCSNDTRSQRSLQEEIRLYLSTDTKPQEAKSRYRNLDIETETHLRDDIKPLHLSTRPQGHRQEITPLDNLILQKGGTTAALERLPHRARQGKTRSTAQARVAELTWENSNLRAEIARHEEIGHSHKEFHARVVEGYNTLRLALHDLSESMERADQQMAARWGFNLDGQVCEDLV